MKYLARIFIVTVLVTFSFASYAGNKMTGNCQLFGSWIGYDETGAAWWTTKVDGHSSARGTLVLQVPQSVTFYPGATDATQARGVWERTGGNTFDWTVVSIAFDETFTTLYQARVSGKDTIGDDCDTLYVSDIVMELFDADADLNSDDPIGMMLFPDHPGHRIKVVNHELP